MGSRDDGEEIFPLRYRASRYLSACFSGAFETGANTGRIGEDRKRPDGTKIEPGRPQTVNNTG